MLISYIDQETREKRDIELTVGDPITFGIYDIGDFRGFFQGYHVKKIYVRDAVLFMGVYPSHQVDDSYYQKPRNFVLPITNVFDIRKSCDRLGSNRRAG